MPKGAKYSEVYNIIYTNKLNTICTSGNCPNKGECWNAGTASFMILGNVCSRNCKFCDVIHGTPQPVDFTEPETLAAAIKKLKLRHAVITSVTRDDLPDSGAQFWADTISAVKATNRDITIEALIPDMKGNKKHLQTIINAKPDVISHNMETVERLTRQVRNVARYELSINVLKYISESGIITKSGIMVGIGETDNEVLATLSHMRSVGVSIVTIGQYLQPRNDLHPVIEYITPDKFAFYKEKGLEMGFTFVESSPLVRSSYGAEKHAAKCL